MTVGQARGTKLPPPHTVPPHPQGQVGTTRDLAREVGAASRLAQEQQERGPQASASLPPRREGNPRPPKQPRLPSEPRLLQEALHPPYSACTASAPTADYEASAPSPLPRDPGWGLAVVDKTTEGSRRLPGRGPRWPHLSPCYSAPTPAAPGYATSSRLVGSGGQSHNLQASGCRRVAGVL